MYLDGSGGAWAATGATWQPGSDDDRPRYRFADFFAGLGGFHAGLARLGHECVFASEIDDELRDLYHRNFGLLPAGDIREIDPASVPPHEVLCAGFPCQPFSLAGKKKGAACPKSGKLIDDVFRMVAHHQPKYVMLENVPNVLTIADGKFWAHIQSSFAALRYRVEHRIYSPLQFGLPQQRYRVFIVAAKRNAPPFDWPEPAAAEVRSLQEFIKTDPADVRRIEPAKKAAIDKWNDLVAMLPFLTSDTILASEFGATYPVEGMAPRRPWRHYRGAFGTPLSDSASREDAIAKLPHYAAENGGVAPHWMWPYIATSRAIYDSSPRFFDQWKDGMKTMPNSWQKLEWRGDPGKRDLWQNTIQFRASGIRIMKPHMAPSLVAMTPTQVPIIGSRQRYMAVREAAALQALENLPIFPQNTPRAFKALGNAVNAHIVYELARAVLI